MNRLIVIMATLLAAGCAREIPAPSVAPDDLDPVAEAVRTLTGARTRVIWLKDMGDGADYLARDVNLQLMGFDTDDGHGERMILPAGRNIAKPMFSVDGDRIVFSDRHNGTMHLVDWEGSEPETLGEGFVLHTWRDPTTGIEWLYYAKDLVDDGKILPTHETIYRKGLPPYPRTIHTLITGLRGRLSERRVWTQTQVSEDSYQLSADGRFASAPFPWPEVGVHDIRARRWNRHGRGCWVAMSPDNNYLFWIFDGPHRNITMERIGDPEAAGRWTVRINQLPDTDRYEVYHPRWSNHPHIMAISGPYKVGEGAYRLPGGGTDVEIWLGRFSEDHRAVEHWVRATYNNYANFYPDVWVETDPRAHRHSETADASVAAPPRPIAWPSNNDALVYLWEHGAAQNEITHPEDGQRRIFRPEPRRLARFGGRHEMWVDGGYFVDENAPALSDNFSMEMMITARGDTTEESLILGYDPDHAVIETQGEWTLRWNGESTPLGITPQGDTHFVLNRTGNRLEVFIDGTRRSEIHLESAPQPVSAAHLHFGGHPEIDQDWPGSLSHIAFYQRTLEEREIARNQRLAREAIARQPVSEPVPVRARVLNQSAIPTPADIAPYRRGLVVNEYEITDGNRAGIRFLAAHWAILDGVVLDTADRPVGAEYTLSVALFDKRPELEGERVAMDSEDFLLELYYDLNL